MWKRFRGLRTIFSRLQWKLTFSYTLVTAGVVIVLMLVLAVTAWAFFLSPTILGTAIHTLLTPLSDQAVPLLAQTPPDADALSAWLAGVKRGNTLLITGEGDERFQGSISDVRYLAVVDKTGELLAIEPQTSAPLAPHLWQGAQMVMQSALEGNRNSRTLTAIDQGQGRMFAAVPVVGDDGHVLGALATELLVPTTGPSQLAFALASLLPAVMPILIVAGLMGALFGFVASRGLARRLRALSAAAGSWSQGDFSTFVRDHSGDEIGQLARRLNGMAEQLQNLLHAREQLAAIEERNRLARELHDSVKQQIFATAMQLGAARTQLKQDPEAAAVHLEEAELLVHQAQQELGSLIQELRPAALEGKGLGAALEEYVATWSRQNGIEAQVQAENGQRLPLHVEQALLRVAQEALSNVARHSGAQKATLYLEQAGETIALRVVDDGRGFSLGAAREDGFGLHSMGERIEALGGRLSVESAPGRGTTVTARVPSR